MRTQMRRRMRDRYAASAALLLGVTVACSDSPAAPAVPTERPAFDVSAAIARTIAVTFGTYLPGAEAVAVPGACPYSAGVGAFVCTPQGTGTLTYTMTYYLLDVDGRALDAPSDRVATIRALVDRRGTRQAQTGDGTATTAVVEHHEMLVGGLRSGTLTFSGTVTSHYDFTRDGAVAQRSTQDIVGATTNVLFDDGAPWPRAGAITSSDVTTVVPLGAMSPNVTLSHSLLEFDGTSVITVTTSTDAFTLRCRFDLAGRVATSCS